MMRRLACLAGVAVAAWAQGEAPASGNGLPGEGQVLRYCATWEQGYQLNGKDSYPSKVEAQLAWRLKETTPEGIVLGLRIERLRVEKGSDDGGLKCRLDSEAPEGKESSAWLKEEFEVLVDQGGKVLRAPATGCAQYQKLLELMVGEGWLQLGPVLAGDPEVKVPLLHDMDDPSSRFKDAWLALVPVKVQEAAGSPAGQRRFRGAFKTQPGKGMGIGAKGSEMFLPDAEVQVGVEGIWAEGCWKSIEVTTEVAAAVEGNGEACRVRMHAKLTLVRMP